MEGYDISEIKYLGGMQVIIKFKTVNAARVFKANKSIWMKWLVWVDVYGSRSYNLDCIAWIKITGVPLHAWDEENMMAIAKSLGKVLVSACPFWGSRDISHGKLCILTSVRKKINEDMVVLIDNVKHCIGVFEVDDNWMPFRRFERLPDSDSDEDMAEEGGVSDTYDMADDEAEEGEFIPESLNRSGDLQSPSVKEASAHAAHGMGCTAQAPRAEEHAESNAESTKEHAESIADSTSVNNCIPLSADENTRGGHYGIKICEMGQVGHLDSCGGLKNFNGPNGGVSSPDFNYGDSDAKRRKTKVKLNHNSRKQGHPSQSKRRNSNLSLDLNKIILLSRNSADRSPSTSCANSREVRETIALGKEIEFQIDDGCGKVNSILRGDGEKKETRMTDILPSITNWWDDSDVGVEFVGSIGLSGGLMTFWDKKMFQLIDVIKNRNFLALVGYWDGIVGETILVNVYAPQPPREKKEL
ncbi:hypothetical protein LXL04_000535 [Taraxacum kok-saghyz]